MLKDAESNPIKMGTHTLENLKSKKYLGDQIHEDGTAACISEKLNNRILLAKKKCTEILIICNDPRLVEFNIAKENSLKTLK